MRSFGKFLGLVGLLSLLGTAPGVGADDPAESGSLEAVGPDGKAIGACPLRHTDVEAEIAGFVARVHVTQVFENPFSDPIEARYTFPLPERAAVDDMRIRTGDREIRGEIRRREEAQRIYEEAKQRGQLAALLDEERPNIFTQSIANLMPGETVEILIEYVEPLKYEAGEFEFTFPTVVGPRFIPGEARVPDAGRIIPPVTPEGTRTGHDITISVEIDAGVPIREIDSRLHEVDVERAAENRARVTLRRKREIPNRDFVLRYGVAGEELQSGYLVHRDGDEGYVTFVLLPPRRVTPKNVAPKELVFVIDRSGSQSGLPLTKAKETMLWVLDQMNPNDTFQVVSFSNSTEQLFDRPSPVTPETRRQARTYINALRANGGTMMAEAVQRVAQEPADGNRLRIVTFMTDGYIGNDLEVIDLVRRLRGTSRWFPFGTGNSVNRFLLENMGRYGGGEVEYVLLNEPGEVVAKKFYERIASPVLTDVSLEFRNLDVIDVYPNAVADVWAERPLIVQARYRRPGRGSVIVHGYRQGEPYREELEVELPRRDASSAAIASMWARAKVEDLMAQDLQGLQSGSFPTALREEIVRVALAHRILSPFTSFVAVEDRVVNEGGEVRTVTVPVEMPQGVTYEGVFGTGGEAAAAPHAASKAWRSPGMLSPLATQAPGHVHADRAVATEPVLRERPEEAKPLSAEARRRLAPDLLSLLEGRPAPAAARHVIDGKIRVKVTLRNLSEATLRQVREAGFRISTRTDGYWIGEIEVNRLAELAEIESVVSITLP